jgi:hypothetical protein
VAAAEGERQLPRLATHVRPLKLRDKLRRRRRPRARGAADAVGEEAAVAAALPAVVAEEAGAAQPVCKPASIRFV